MRSDFVCPSQARALLSLRSSVSISSISRASIYPGFSSRAPRTIHGLLIFSWRTKDPRKTSPSSPPPFSSRPVTLYQSSYRVRRSFEFPLSSVILPPIITSPLFSISVSPYILSHISVSSLSRASYFVSFGFSWSLPTRFLPSAPPLVFSISLVSRLLVLSIPVLSSVVYSLFSSCLSSFVPVLLSVVSSVFPPFISRLFPPSSSTSIPFLLLGFFRYRPGLVFSPVISSVVSFLHPYPLRVSRLFCSFFSTAHIVRIFYSSTHASYLSSSVSRLSFLF